MKYKALLEQHGGIGFEKQHSLFELIGESDWSVDLDTELLTFSNGEEFKIQVLGSYGYNAETWLWQWANTQSGGEESVYQDALKLKALGEKEGIDLFTTAEFKCNTTEVHLLGVISSSILGSSAYYCGDYGDGIALMTIKSDKIDNVEYVELLRIAETFSSLISIREMNHKEAFINYMVAKKYEHSLHSNSITASKGDKSITATFDELDRLTDLKTNIK